MRNAHKWIAAFAAVAILAGVGPRTCDADEISYTTGSRNALSYFKAGLALRDNLYLEAGAEQFRKAIEIDPRFAMAYLQLATIVDSYTEYRENLDKAYALIGEVSDGERLIIEAAMARADNRPADEERLLIQLVSLFPAEVASHTRLADVYFSNSEYALSVEELEEAIAINDEYPPAYNSLGYSYAFLGEFDRAIETLGAYSTLIPDEPNPYDSLAEVYLMAGRYDEAIDKYTITLEIDPYFYSAYLGRGHAYLFKGEKERALEEYRKMSEIAPTPFVRREAMRWMAICELYFGEYDAAHDGLKAVEQEALEAGEVLSGCNRALDIAWIHMVRDAFSEATAELEYGWQKMMASGLPESAKRSYARRHTVVSGIRAALAGDIDAAHAAAQKIKRLVESGEDLEEWRDYNWLMGEILLIQEDNRGALANLLHAPKENPRVFYLLGTVHQKRGDRGRAAVCYRNVANYNRPSVLHAITHRDAERALK